MFYIVESEKTLKQLESLGQKGCFMEIVTSNDNFHPKLASLVAVYIRPLEEIRVIEDETGKVLSSDSKGYIIPVNHDEGLNVSKDRINTILQHYSKIYVCNKKRVLYYFNNLGKNCIDITLRHSMLTFETENSNVREKTYDWFYNRYGGVSNLNQIIPLPKIYERCESVYLQVKDLLSEPDPAGFDFYNEIATKIFFLVEQTGIRVDRHEFITRFKPNNADFSINGETVYTNYNLYNITSRPTNSFNSVNFLAIPKGIEFRRCFKPFNDRFIQYDFDGYHVRLVANLVDYDLNTGIKAHKQLATQRSGKTEFTHAEYVQAKADNFKMIYGNPSDEDKTSEFSQKIQKYIDTEWKQFKKVGKVVNTDSGKEFTKKLKDMYNSKLFNYMIQSIETSRNIKVLYNILRYLSKVSAKSKIILVTYDAFLLDYAESDGPELVQKIKDIMEGEDHRFPVSVEESKDLNFE